MRLLQLGKIGDILAIIPILYHEYQQTGEKQQLIIAEEFSSLLEGTSYIEPLIYPGDWRDITGALDWFGGKALTTQVVGNPETIVSQVYGKSPYRINKNHDSFVKDMWNLAGKMNLWSQQPPLVFDRRDKEREDHLLWEAQSKVEAIGDQVIIVSDSGISSPFPHKKLLRELVTKRWPGRVLFMDEFKAERFYDLLGILEHPWVKAIIATDSAILHLAHATTKPVCALITDTPSLWHGSAFRKGHLRYIKYNNFPRDAVEMLNTIDNL